MNRLIRPVVATSFGVQGGYHGYLMQYHSNPNLPRRPLNLVWPQRLIKPPACERTPLVPSTSKLSTYKILGPGMILLKRYVSIKDQVDIVNICQKWGMGSGGLYMTADRRRYTMCLGRNWDPVTKYANRCRSDGSEPPPLSHELISLAQAAVQDAQAHLKELPSMQPDICVVNFYRSCFGQLDLHQDCDESFDSLKRGLPVVSISIGEMSEFLYGHTRKKLKSVTLKSGDVLIFGGKSRHIYHAVTQICQYTAPEPLIDESGLLFGRLSLTFRQI